MSQESIDYYEPKLRPFISMSLQSVSSPEPGTSVSTSKNRRQEDEIKGQFDNPHIVSPGLYDVILHVKWDFPTPTEVKGKNVDVYRYAHWHFKESGEAQDPDQKPVEIRALWSSGGSSSKTSRYSPMPTIGEDVLLGKFEVESRQSYKVMLIGDVHRLFFDDGGLFLEKFNGNLSYYVAASDCAHLRKDTS